MLPISCSWLKTPPWFLEGDGAAPTTSLTPLFWRGLRCHPPGVNPSWHLKCPAPSPAAPNLKIPRDFRGYLPLGLARSGASAGAGTAPWLCFPSSLQAAENIIKQLHPARICQENEAGGMKSGRGARKHEQAVPCQREAGAAPGEVSVPRALSPPSPQAAPGPQPGSSSRKEPGICLPGRKSFGKVGGYCTGINPLVAGGWRHFFVVDGLEGALGCCGG